MRAAVADFSPAPHSPRDAVAEAVIPLASSASRSTDGRPWTAELIKLDAPSGPASGRCQTHYESQRPPSGRDGLPSRSSDRVWSDRFLFGHPECDKRAPCVVVFVERACCVPTGEAAVIGVAVVFDDACPVSGSASMCRPHYGKVHRRRSRLRRVSVFSHSYGRRARPGASSGSSAGSILRPIRGTTIGLPGRCARRRRKPRTRQGRP
jgi:hypothetical protein